MASVVTPRIRFLHVPKTGGIWVARAMMMAGVPTMRAGMPYHANLEQSAQFDGLFTFAFVRHPLAFWRSYWGYKLREGCDPENPFDMRVLLGRDFNAFIEAIVADDDGGATRIYESFVGPPDDEIDFIGHNERLADDVVAALTRAGEPFDEQALRRFPRVNSNDYDGQPVLYRPETARLIADYERGAIERFYPDDPIPARLVEE